MYLLGESLQRIQQIPPEMQVQLPLYSTSYFVLLLRTQTDGYTVFLHHTLDPLSCRSSKMSNLLIASWQK